MPKDVIPILKTFPMFSGAKESTLLELVPSCIFQSFSAGITINKAGQVPDYVYCLRSGSVEGWAHLNDAETIIATSSAPIVFEVSTAIQNHPSVLSIVTREPSETIAIEARAFLKAVNDDQAVCHAALVHASRINLLMIDRLLDHKLRTAEQRLGQWILAAMERNGNSATVKIHFSKRALAYELGMSPANLSRLFHVFREHGVEISGMNMTITDLHQLRQLARD
ncbi:helix-turn-helix domain-containing protein [Bosea vaviloviae]|uniref:helix-turn-helix domain-containing protein n=1 Tax=Bosea vaviloviae TaxID=1526658 RepID=UPI0009ECA72F|nr:helix-turn-helix domain-containing protein [Bosea vaviloviae]